MSLQKQIIVRNFCSVRAGKFGRAVKLRVQYWCKNDSSHDKVDIVKVLINFQDEKCRNFEHFFMSPYFAAHSSGQTSLLFIKSAFLRRK